LSGEVVALSSAFLWAIASVLLTIGARRVHVVPMNLVRCLVATGFFWGLLPFYGGFHALTTVPLSSWLWLFVSVLGLLVIGDSLYFRSMDLAGVSWAMPVVSINPLWSVLLAALLVGEPLNWALLLGAVLVVAGMILVSRTVQQTSQGQLADPRRRRTGLLLALLASILWGIGNVALKPGTAGMHSIVANSIRQPMAALILLAPSLQRGRWRELLHLDRKSWAVILAASIIGTGFGTLLFVMAIQRVGAGRTSVLTATTSLMAMPFSMLWLRERPNRWTVVGTLLTTVGIALVV
jgi:drug/metabolite transporter (DMT)-like permease